MWLVKKMGVVAVLLGICHMGGTASGWLGYPRWLGYHLFWGLAIAVGLTLLIIQQFLRRGPLYLVRVIAGLASALGFFGVIYSALRLPDNESANWHVARHLVAAMVFISLFVLVCKFIAPEEGGEWDIPE